MQGLSNDTRSAWASSSGNAKSAVIPLGLQSKSRRSLRTAEIENPVWIGSYLGMRALVTGIVNDRNPTPDHMRAESRDQDPV